MAYEDALNSNQQLIARLGQPNAHLVWALAMHLEHPDPGALASEALTDGSDDKKIDFIQLDQDSRRIVFAQGYYGKSAKDSAPANKASDLNTAAAWLFSADLNDVPHQLRPVVERCREALQDGEVESIELLYVHNLPESVNVAKELQAAAAQLRKVVGDSAGVSVAAKELGRTQIEHLFSTQESHIEVKDEIACPAAVSFTEVGPKWRAHVMSVPGSWLHSLFTKHGESLFSANYRGFLGITKRRRINTGIRATAEAQPRDFWVFNNGITLLTMAVRTDKDGVKFTGLSVINGAQTSGSIGSVETAKHDLKDVRVLCRVIECSDPEKVKDIVRYNNTQNEITTWDQYSNDPDQNRLAEEFKNLGHAYSRKRGFAARGEQVGIEEIAQPLVAFHGKFPDANRGKNMIFERRALYNLAFANKKARHVLFVYSLARAIDERRIDLKNKSSGGTIIALEEKQLALLRHLKLKYFMIAVVARVLETIMGRKIDAEAVAFSPEAANAKNNSLTALVAAWSPVVEAILTFLATEMPDPSVVTQRIGEEGALEQVADKVGAMLYASRSALSFEAFRQLVTDS